MTLPKNSHVFIAPVMSVREFWRYSIVRRCPNFSEHIPNIFTNVLGVSHGGMTWKTYKRLSGKDAEQKAWHSIASKVAKAVAGKEIVANPFLSFLDSPCEPGLLIFHIDRTFKEWVTRESIPAISSELIWDFYPRWAGAEQVKPMETETYDEDPNFRFHSESSLKPRGNNGKEKKIVIDVFGKTVKQLKDVQDLKNRIINMELFEDSIFDEEFVYVVDKVYYVDKFELRILIDGEVKTSRSETSRFPVGFTVREVRIGWDEFETRCIKRVSKKSFRKMRVSWVQRSRFWYYFRQGIANCEKYGSAAGDYPRISYIPNDIPNFGVRERDHDEIG
ncbi:uncharacterized protein LOC127715662 [Mytilus californianus]|uniref:uncharacterized protein LOC127715662 n=1 Tax=Mytilus californianus TaxID=6549 RepID=UPI002247E204|nr:uncharacterized protein LOC127715662 [Mytilus californianus]